MDLKTVREIVAAHDNKGSYRRWWHDTTQRIEFLKKYIAKYTDELASLEIDFKKNAIDLPSEEQVEEARLFMADYEETAKQIERLQSRLTKMRRS